MVPVSKAMWPLDGKQPPEPINLELYEKLMVEYFGANRSIVEVRLKELGHKLMNSRYEWAGYTKESHAPGQPTT